MRDRKSIQRKTSETLARLFWHAGLRPAPRQFTFIVSWMRSGSSLLSNLVLADDTWFGIGETHVRHVRGASLTEVVLVSSAIRWQIPTQSTKVYLDKVLHNHLDAKMPAEVIENSTFIFLTRDVRQSATSISRMWKGTPQERYHSPFDYLSTRISRLHDLALMVPRDNRFLIDFDDVVQGSDVFRDLGTFLGHPLSREYDVPNYVGRKGIGDFSSRIRLGRIDNRPPQPAVYDACSDAEFSQLSELVGSLSGTFQS